MSLDARLARIMKTSEWGYVKALEAKVVELQARIDELEADRNRYAEMTDAEIDAELELIDRRLAEARKGRAETARGTPVAPPAA
jgi:cell division septum initiation protein DivIVA